MYILLCNDVCACTSRGVTICNFLAQLGNVEVMKVLAALGADVNLPDDCIPCKRPSTVHNTYTPYMPTEEEAFVFGCATGVHAASLRDTFVFDSAPLNNSMPPKNNGMVTLLREIGAVNTCRKPALKCSIEHGHMGRYSGGTGNHESRHPIKKSMPQSSAAKAPLLTEPATPLLSLVPDGEVTPDQAVEVLKRLQACKSEQRKRGVRVLCLDGGGVKGLVELEILRQIEEKLGGGDITCLFDYIVGTSTGGIIALGMVYGKCTGYCTIKNTTTLILISSYIVA